MECKNCCYFGFSGNPDWIGKDGKEIEHCLFCELRDDWETAPCDYPDYDDGYDEY